MLVIHKHRAPAPRLSALEEEDNRLTKPRVAQTHKNGFRPRESHMSARTCNVRRNNPFAYREEGATAVAVYTAGNPLQKGLTVFSVPSVFTAR